VTIERSTLFALYKLATGYQPVEGSHIPLAVAEAERILASERPPDGAEIAAAMLAQQAKMDPELYGPGALPIARPPSFVELVGPEPTFDDFYEVYPLKKKKPDALRAWNRAIKRATPHKIMDGARAWRAHWEELPRREWGTFPGYPATWLNNDCWADEIIPHRNRSKVETTRRNLQAGADAIQHGSSFAERMRRAGVQRELES
jgi:hypothetical protein